MAADSAEFIQLSRLALSYSPGLSVKMQVDGEKRKSLVFVTTSGLYPWDERMDNMKSQTDAMLAQEGRGAPATRGRQEARGGRRRQD